MSGRSHSSAARPYLTKVWVGRHWRYLHTRRAYYRSFRRCGVVSFKRSREEF